VKIERCWKDTEVLKHRRVFSKVEWLAWLGYLLWWTRWSMMTV